MKPVIIAHRGASALALHENSLEAFQIAIDIQADYVEFDIRKTKDDYLIIFHDDSYEGHPVSSLTYSELCLLTSRKGLYPPLFSEVLSLCKGKIKLDIELKEAGFEQRVVEMTKAGFSYNDFLIKSFLDFIVLSVKKFDKNVRSGLLTGVKNAAFPTRIREYFPERRLRLCQADFISPHYKFVTKGFIRRMQHQKKDIYVWTLNNDVLIDTFLKKPVTGIITDYPDTALKKRAILQES